jgi:hypothetical protein
MHPTLASWLQRRADRRWERAVRVVGRRAVDIQAATGCSWEEARARASALPVATPINAGYQELDLPKALRLISVESAMPERLPSRPVLALAKSAPETQGACRRAFPQSRRPGANRGPLRYE